MGFANAGAEFAKVGIRLQPDVLQDYGASGFDAQVKAAEAKSFQRARELNS